MFRRFRSKFKISSEVQASVSMFAHPSFSLHETAVLRIDILQGVRKQGGDIRNDFLIIIESSQTKPDVI